MEETRDASTFYSALNAAGVILLLCMIWVDGFGYNKFSTHGLLWTDAALNLLVCAIVLIVFVIHGVKPATQSCVTSTVSQHLSR